MTAVRPEGGTQPGRGADDWGVYEAAPQQPTPQQPAPQPSAPHRGGAPGGQEAGWQLDDRTMQLRTVPEAAAPAAPAPTAAPEGRAERRRAAASGLGAPGTGRRRAQGRSAPARPRPPEKKRVVLARALGEGFITLGLVMLLFVAYQLWWTNVQADASANAAGDRLEQQWNSAPQPTGSAKPGATLAGQFEPGKGFALLYIPKLGLKYPIAEGTQKQQVLDKGLVGHYTGTAMPADRTGNFAIAAHRTTHGQPFRKIGQLAPGDKIVVETAIAFYTYEVAGGIPETPPTNVTVIQSVPKGSPFTQPGRYITLTTCTPEFSARGRLIVFGKMLEERPRSQGKPAALTG
ncbi:class E sortase [Streptomyces sp. NRRL B-24484]|uniref:class E sortase n=1 Tax=Streptomyces sp. NRRL B-24484 TaxID=1463833 RepID=UPI00069321EC|nr:class E sortase [Streptomyces sp. NRRL B-24484]